MRYLYQYTFVSTRCPRELNFTWCGCYGLCQRHKSTQLARSFLLCFCVCFSLMVLSTVFYFIKSPHNSPFSPPQWGAADAKYKKSHLVRTRSLNVLPLKPGVGRYIAIHATLIARDFFLAHFYPSGPFTCIFSKTSPDFSYVGCG